MADTATKDTKSSKSAPVAEATVEERLDRLEVAVGIHPADSPELTPAVPGEPLKQHELYATDPEAEAALAKAAE